MTPDDLVALYRSPHSAPPLLALAGLEEVDWSAVSDAYGPATDVPALLRALVSGNLDHREFACRLLHQTIWHPGKVYSATAAAIPSLYNLLEADGPQDTGRSVGCSSRSDAKSRPSCRRRRGPGMSSDGGET